MNRRGFINGLLAVSFGLSLSTPGLAQGQAGNRVNVLIGFRGGVNAEDVAIVRSVGGQVRFAYTIVPAMAASVPEAALRGLAQDARVTVIEEDGLFHAIDHATTSGDDELNNSWGVKHIGSGTVHALGNSGAGAKVAVIDTGIDRTHPDLIGNFAGGYDFVNNDSDPMDDHGHGTHVAGTIAAADNAAGVVGVAPGASLYALKVLDASGSGSFSSVIAALDWCVQNGIQISNNSYGSSLDPGSIVRAAFDNSSAAGVLHVAAAGNSGNPKGSGNNVNYPARYASVIAVAATDENDIRASFSSTGEAVELAAPGLGINSTLLGGGYGTASGTSMASPHLAGAAALVIASGITDANGDGKINDDVRLRLQSTADDLGAAGRDTQYGYGLVDADEAAPAPATTGSIAGTVVNAADLTPIPGAAVTVDTGQSATADSLGQYSIGGVPTGDRTVTASASGFESASQVVTVTQDTTSTADFALNAIQTGSISGTVTNAGDGSPILGATVSVGSTGQSATTDLQGNYSIGDVPVGTHTVTASASGFESASQVVTVSQNANSTANFALTAITTATTATVSSIAYATAGGKNNDKDLYITLTVVDNLGNPVGGASVSITLKLDKDGDGFDDGSWSGTATTGSDGKITFKLTNAPKGCYTTTVNNVTAAGLTWDGNTPANIFCK